MTPRPPIFAAVLFLAVACPPSASAQFDEVPPPAAYALEGVTVVYPDGERLEDATVVIRDHILLEMGADTGIPVDARVLEGEGLWVYPGLVDAWGAAEMELPAPPERSEVTEWDPSRDAQGYVPHRRVVDHLVADGSSLHEQRAAGVVASGVFSGQGYMAGLGAALLHRPEAAFPRELVAEPEVGLAVSFAPSSTSYPSTVLGVMAHLRQAFSDAQHLASVEAAYRQNPNGLAHPKWDPDAEVLRRVAGAGLRAFFSADRVHDIRRVLGLAYEIGFTPVIVGGGEAWRLAEELAALDVPVLVSLDFPEPTAWNPDAEGTAGGGQDLEPAAARERERLIDLYSNPARLEEAGVRFALTSGGGFADLREGARTAIEYGLSEEAALRALTTRPAGILGVGPVTGLVSGHAANMVVTDAPLFDEQTRVVYTFVEGVLDEMGLEAEASDEVSSGVGAGDSP